MTRFLLCTGVVSLLLGGCGGGQDYSVADLTVHAPAGPGCAGLSVTWMGITTLIISDGETTLMTDGYFSRPSQLALTGAIAPDRQVIAATLQQLGVAEAAAVMVVHSHYDHALDAPVVAEMTGAMLLGSESTANVGRGLSLPEEQLRVLASGDTLTFGQFTVRFVESRHWPLPEPWASRLSGTIDTPLVPPASALDYKEGTTWSIVLEHPRARLLVQGSAGYVPGALDEVAVDAVLLGTGGLADLPVAEQEAYFQQVVLGTGAQAVFPIHWDVMTTPPGAAFQPEADFQRSMKFLVDKQAATGVRLALFPQAEAVCLPLPPAMTTE